MGFYVIETQTNNGVDSVIATTYATRAEAEQKYHLILSAAAVSQIEKHGAFLMADDYRDFKREIYDRTVTEQEPLED